MNYDYDDNYSSDYYGYEDKYSSYYNDEYQDEYSSKKKSFYDEEENDEDNDDSEKLAETMDNDLAGYFSDARLFSSPKKKMGDTIKKKPKKIVYKAGEKIVVSANRAQNVGHILFGPYEANKKQMYQIELETGELVEADDKHIKKSA